MEKQQRIQMKNKSDKLAYHSCCTTRAWVHAFHSGISSFTLEASVSTADSSTGSRHKNSWVGSCTSICTVVHFLAHKDLLTGKPNHTWQALTQQVYNDTWQALTQQVYMTNPWKGRKSTDPKVVYVRGNTLRGKVARGRLYMGEYMGKCVPAAACMCLSPRVLHTCSHTHT